MEMGMGMVDFDEQSVFSHKSTVGFVIMFLDRWILHSGFGGIFFFSFSLYSDDGVYSTCRERLAEGKGGGEERRGEESRRSDEVRKKFSYTET